VHNDQTANLLVDSKVDLFINLIFAVKRHTKMPEIILEMVRKIIQTPTGRKAMERGEQILPYPLILDNCSGHKKVNLCRNCQSEFSFNNIVKDFCSEEDDGYFSGIEQNNLGLLQETKVLCANCIRDLHNEVINLNDLLHRIKELIA
ncbi:ABC-three component system protein, partial [Peribacillus sp. NPDC060186]